MAGVKLSLILLAAAVLAVSAQEQRHGGRQTSRTFLEGYLLLQGILNPYLGPVVSYPGGGAGGSVVLPGGGVGGSAGTVISYPVVEYGPRNLPSRSFENKNTRPTNIYIDPKSQPDFAKRPEDTKTNKIFSV